MPTEPHLGALQEVLDAFNRHDLDAIMSHFAEDCVFESPGVSILGAPGSLAWTRYGAGWRLASTASQMSTTATTPTS